MAPKFSKKKKKKHTTTSLLMKKILSRNLIHFGIGMSSIEETLQRQMIYMIVKDKIGVEGLRVFRVLEKYHKLEEEKVGV